MSLTVVEIFQSQGCSACPPTFSKLLALLADLGPSCLLLTYHVSYWDDLGWRDTFAKQLFNDRQHDYVKRLGLENVFTPQIVVNGRASGVVREMDELRRLVERGGGGGESQCAPGVRVEVDGSIDDQHGVMINVARGEVEGDLDLWLVAYDPGVVEVDVMAGENVGRRLPYQNVVKSVERIGFFEGQDMERDFLVEIMGNGTLSFMVLVQQGYGGPVVGTISPGTSNGSRAIGIK